MVAGWGIAAQWSIFCDHPVPKETPFPHSCQDTPTCPVPVLRLLSCGAWQTGSREAVGEGQMQVLLFQMGIIDFKMVDA